MNTTIDNALLFLTAGVFIFIIVTSVLSKIQFKKKGCNAKFAQRKDFKDRLDVKKYSCVIGHIETRLGHQALYSKSNEHIVALMKTGGGKGVSLIVPTLLTFEGSVFVNDIKGENYRLTAKYRRDYFEQKVFRLDFANEESAGFNIFDQIDWEETPVEKLTNLSIALIQKEGNEKGDDYFVKTARDLFVGICFAQKEFNEEKGEEIINLGEIYDFAMQEKNEFFERLQNCENSQSQRSYNAFSGMAENQYSGVIGALQTGLSVFNDPYVRKNVKKSDFKIKDLLDRKISVYLCIQPKDLERFSPLLKIIYQLILNNLAVSKNDGQKNNKLLMLVDEANSIGSLDIFKKGTAYFRGYGIILYMIYQSYSQILDTWGSKHSGSSLMENFSVWITGGSMDSTTCSMISGMVGERKVKRGQAVIRERLITPEGVKSLKELQIKLDEEGFPVKIKKPGEAIIFANQHTIKSCIVPYFFYKSLDEKRKYSES